MSTIDWDKFKKNTTGDYPERWKPENVGDKITGKVLSIRVATMPDGAQYPSITLETATGQAEVLASQTQLLSLLAAKQPNIGDVLTIEHTGIEKLSGGRTLKQFNVETQAGKNEPAGDIL